MKSLLALLIGLGCATPLLAQDLPFSGRWLLDDQQNAQTAAYTILTIEGASMSWSGPDKSVPACVQQFAHQKEAPGTTYTNGHGTKFITGVTGSLPTYLLKISTSNCSGIEDAVRISYPLVYDTRHIEVIEYVKGKPVTSRRFLRKK
jgi:hypothetical protein